MQQYDGGSGIQQQSIEELEAEAQEVSELEELLAKYRNVNDWNKETIQSFMDDLVTDKQPEYLTQDISYQQLKETGLPQFKNLNP